MPNKNFDKETKSSIYVIDLESFFIRLMLAVGAYHEYSCIKRWELLNVSITFLIMALLVHGAYHLIFLTL